MAVLRYLLNIAIALDQLGNVVLLNGDPRETISEHAAHERVAGRIWGCLLCRVLDGVLRRPHCENMTKETARE